MGWGCYLHEVDAGSEAWDKKIAEITPPEYDPWGRDEAVCPWCYEHLAYLCNAVCTALSVELQGQEVHTLTRYSPAPRSKELIDAREFLEKLGLGRNWYRDKLWNKDDGEVNGNKN